jgi:hypothetical protein
MKIRHITHDYIAAPDKYAPHHIFLLLSNECVFRIIYIK